MLTGLGQDGYLRVQKETAYKTATVNAMTLLPLMEGTMSFESSRIEKKNIINSRLMQKSDDGRQLVGPADLTFPIHPDLIGMFMNLFFGAETAVTGDGSATPYVHTFLVPVTGSTAGISWTMQQAIGSNLADQFHGIKMTKFVIKMDNEKDAMIVGTFVGVLRDADGIARPATFTLTASKEYIFGDGGVTLTPGKAETFTVTIGAPGVVTQANHGLATGMAVKLATAGTLPTGLNTTDVFYVIRIDRNTFNLATTYANAIAGTKITTSATQTGAHTLVPQAIAQKVNSLECEVSLGYAEDGARFKVGSVGADSPVFGTLPYVKFKCEIDGEKIFADAAAYQTEFAIDLALIHRDIAVATYPYKFEVEIPRAVLTSGTKQEAAVDLNTMSLEYDSLGGLTTGSGAVLVPAEVRVTDMTATYTSY